VMKQTIEPYVEIILWSGTVMDYETLYAHLSKYKNLVKELGRYNHYWSTGVSATTLYITIRMAKKESFDFIMAIYRCRIYIQANQENQSLD
jgi:hypothetical protein